jgi:hypothetical protein
LKRWPANEATSATIAIAATVHGSATDVALATGSRSAAVPPAGVPQRWQKWAPALSSAWQPAQRAEPATAPQFAQNFPATGESQVAQRGSGVAGAPDGLVTGDDMREGRDTTRRAAEAPGQPES